MVEKETKPSAGGPSGTDDDAQRAAVPSGLGPVDELTLLQAAWEASPDAVLFVQRATLRVAAANPAACHLLGYAPEELQGVELLRIAPESPELAGFREGEAPAEPAERADVTAMTMARQEPRPPAVMKPHPVRISFRNCDGTAVPVECRVRVVAAPAGEYLVLVARATGESLSPVAGDAWRVTGLHYAPPTTGHPPPAGDRDGLTGLPDRRQFEGRLIVALRKARCRGDYHFGVLFIDLDGFKAVNDAWGHLHGDRVLQEIAARLQTCFRPEDMVARFGGDEFTVLLDHLRDPSDVVRVAGRVRSGLETPVEIEGRRANVTASIGIALSWHGYRDPEVMLHDADRAMYRAKAEGKARYFIWAPEREMMKDE